jgi:hypothetical protein
MLFVSETAFHMFKSALKLHNSLVGVMSDNSFAGDDSDCNPDLFNSSVMSWSSLLWAYDSRPLFLCWEEAMRQLPVMPRLPALR